MFIDWNGNGNIDPNDIALSLAMEEAGVFDEEDNVDEEDEVYEDNAFDEDDLDEEAEEDYD